MAPKHDPKMRRLRSALHLRRREAADERTSTRKVRRARKAIASLELRIAKTQARRKGLDHEAILDGCPLPLGQKLVLLDARKSGLWVGVLTSADRRSAIKGLLRKLGKQDQAELYYGYTHHLPGYLPANPPTQGTHIRIGDGTVGAVGEALEWWQEGIDSTEADELRSALNALGYPAYQPYPTASEDHHTNLRQNPHDRLIERNRL